MRNRWLKRLLLTGTLIIGIVPSASAQYHVSGLIALIARHGDIQNTHNTTNAGVSPFDAAQGRIFFDGQISDRVSGFVQLYLGKNYDAFVYGAYIRYDHSPRLHLDAGLIPLPVGLWGPRTYPNKNPLVGVPLMYQYKSGLNPGRRLQTTADDILTARATSTDAPFVYDFCWNTGIHGYGSVGPFDVGIALQTGSLGSPSRDYKYDYPNVLAHLSWVPGPWLKVGGWVATGPYLSPGLESELPVTNQVEDYHQQTAGALAHVSYGHWDFYAEGMVNRFEHPYLGDLDASGGYVDARYGFAPKWFVAGRAEGLTFSRLDQSMDPAESHWEYPISRFEFGVGHHLTRKVTMKAVAQIARYHAAPSSLDDEIVALQFVSEI